MTALTSVRRRWTAWALGAGLLAAALLAVLGYVGVDTLRNSREGRPANTLPAGRTLPPTPAALLAVRGGSGELAALAVLALAPPGSDGVAKGGTIIPVPVGAGLQDGTDLRRIRLADFYAEGGIGKLADVAGSLLTLNFSLVAEVDEAALADLLRPIGEVAVSMPSDVVDSVDGATDGSEEVVLAAGDQEVDPNTAAAVIVAQRQGEPESARFERVFAYWTGVQNHVGDGLSSFRFSPTGGTGIDDIEGFLGSVLSGPVTVYALRGEPISRGPENPDGLDVYRLNSSEIARVMATVLPDAISPIEVVFTVQIINPTGDPALTQAAVERLAFQGVGIILVRELGGIEVPAVTQFSLGGKAALDEVKPYIDGLGENVQVPLGPAGTPHGRVLSIDVNVVLGQSFIDLVERQSPTTTVASTTSTTEAAG